MLRVLLTNDDGIHADGLQTLRRALAALEDVVLAVIAPDAQHVGHRPLDHHAAAAVGRPRCRSTTARSATRATARRSTACGSPSSAWSSDFEPDLVVAGINHGSNLGDDITYSGTVAAALEGVVLGVPGIAVSQQSLAREMDFRLGREFDFETAAAFTARIVDRLDDVPLPDGTLLNINVPAGEADGVEVDAARQADLPRRARAGRQRRGGPQALPRSTATRRSTTTRRAPTWRRSPPGGSRSRRCTSTSRPSTGSTTLRAYDLARLLAPAAEEIAE